jgi:uncharacterized membrane protein YgcG
LVIGARGFDGEGADNAGGAFVYPGEIIADLAVEMTDKATEGQVGETLEYTFRVSNPSDQEIPEARVLIPRPADVAHSETDSAGVCFYGEKIIRCNVGALEGEAATTFKVQIVPKPEAQGELQVQGWLQAEGVIDPEADNNTTDQVTTDVAAGTVNTEPVSGGTSDGSSSSGCSSGGGGCTLQRSGFFDPTFPILVAFGAFWLLRRRAEWG